MENFVKNQFYLRDKVSTGDGKVHSVTNITNHAPDYQQIQLDGEYGFTYNSHQLTKLTFTEIQLFRIAESLEMLASIYTRVYGGK